MEQQPPEQQQQQQQQPEQQQQHTIDKAQCSIVRSKYSNLYEHLESRISCQLVSLVIS
jgi:hypothetical protein